MLKKTNCDAVMIGRAAIGNPWLLKECAEYLETGELISKPTNKDKLEMIKHHYRLLKEDKNESVALLEIRYHALAYLKGMPDAKIYKDLLCKAKNEEEFLNILNDYEKNLNE